MRRLELVEIHRGKPYYKIQEGQNISYAFGFEQARKYVNGEVSLTDSQIIEEHSKLIRLITMTKLRNLLIRTMENKK